MSQLFSAFGIDWRLLLIQAVNFAVLLGALTYFLYRPILRIIDERQKKIAEGVKTAALAQKKLEDATSESQQMVGDAAREAEALTAHARAQAQTRADEITRAAEMNAQTTLKDAQARAEEAKRLALKESEKEIARAAMLAAEKLLREKNA